MENKSKINGKPTFKIQFDDFPDTYIGTIKPRNGDLLVGEFFRDNMSYPIDNSKKIMEFQGRI